MNWLQELNRYFRTLSFRSAWCFQGPCRGDEERRVEILASPEGKRNNSYDFCIRSHQPGLCKERCSTAYPPDSLSALLETKSLTFGGHLVEAELPGSFSPTTLGWSPSFWEGPWNECRASRSSGCIGTTTTRVARIARKRRPAVPDVTLVQ